MSGQEIGQERDGSALKALGLTGAGFSWRAGGFLSRVELLVSELYSSGSLQTNTFLCLFFLSDFLPNEVGNISLLDTMLSIPANPSAFLKEVYCFW